MFKVFLKAIFVGDANWAWRRRVALSSAAVMLAGILNSIFWDKDLAHATMIMTNCMTGLTLVFTVYVGGAIVDDQYKRKTDPSGRESKP